MNPLRPPLALATLAVLGVAVAVHGAMNPAVAQSQTDPAPHFDDDGDGLDNATERRLGLPHDNADADADGLSDLAELMHGTDPLVFQTAAQIPSAEPCVVTEAYSTGGYFVVQVFAQYRSSFDMLRLHLATESGYKTIAPQHFLPYLNRSATLPAYDPAYRIASLRFALPAQYFRSLGAFAFAAQARLDGGHLVADEFRFQSLNPQQLLEELRETSAQYSGGQGGGLFPANPYLPPPPGEIRSDLVCIQVLSASGTVGPGGILYAVDEAYCDALVDAVCVESCELTVGETVIGIDLASLIN